MATLNLGRIKPVFKGAYSGATAYVVDDIVTSGDESFICILASTGNATSNATYWTKLAAKGTDGTDVGTTITTQGDILYRDGSGVARLAAGTAGQALLSGGAGANPSWGTVDLEGIKSDINILAIREATTAASSAFNLPSTHIETFTDNNNVTETTGGVAATGYWGSIYTAYAATASTVDWYNPLTGGVAGNDYKMYMNGSVGQNNTWYDVNSTGDASFTSSKWVDPDAAVTNGSGYPNYWNSYGADYYILFDFLEAKRFGDTLRVGKVNTWGDISAGKISYSLDNGVYTDLNLSASAYDSVAYGGSGASGGVLSNMAADGTFDTSKHSTGALYNSVGKLTSVPDFTARYIKVAAMSAHGSTANNNSGWGLFDMFHYPLSQTVNAAGTVVQKANAVTGTRTTVGGTLLYKDAGSGTATLGTDLSIFFSCDGGSNWTACAGYTAYTPEYSTGVKMVRLSETTCTGGTDVRYKAVFANQAAGTQETQLHAISTNY